VSATVNGTIASRVAAVAARPSRAPRAKWRARRAWWPASCSSARASDVVLTAAARTSPAWPSARSTSAAGARVAQKPRAAARGRARPARLRVLPAGDGHVGVRRARLRPSRSTSRRARCAFSVRGGARLRPPAQSDGRGGPAPRRDRQGIGAALAEELDLRRRGPARDGLLDGLRRAASRPGAAARRASLDFPSSATSSASRASARAASSRRTRPSPMPSRTRWPIAESRSPGCR
jgi:hypothetical protein